MHTYGLLMGILGVILSCVILMYACNTCEQSVNYLARNVKSGIKGALFLAPISSAPELMFMLVMVMTGQPDMIMAGVAVTAGSAIFNGCLIPALSILMGKYEEEGYFKLCRKTLIRDFSFLLIAEFALIFILGQSEFTIPLAGLLVSIYVCYVMYLIKTSGTGSSENYEYESLKYKGNSNVLNIIRFDFNKVLFNDKPLTTKTSWIILALVIVVLFLGCHILAASLELVAVSVGIPMYFAAVTLGAAATSLPDTILSIKESRKGGQDDAVANAAGSNTFDTTIAVGFPALLALIGGATLPIVQDGDVNILRWFIVGSTLAVFAVLYTSANKVTRWTAVPLLAIYGVWIAYLVIM